MTEPVSEVPPLPRPTAARPRRYSRAMFRAPPAWASAILVIALTALTTGLLASVAGASSAPVFFALVLGPAALAAVATTPVATALRGRFSYRRSLLLAVMTSAVPIPILLIWRVAAFVDGASNPSPEVMLLFVQGPILWFRHMTLFGVAQPSHARSLPASALPPVVASAAALGVLGYSPTLAVDAALFLLIGLGASALLLRAADRPLRREFTTSGVAMIRPLLDHINLRDPAATHYLEGFFRRFAIDANLSVTTVGFAAGPRTKATLALPTVHPGPFAALGASDLPRKLREALPATAGTVFVPHTPCTHDLDLPTTEEVQRVAELTRRLAASSAPVPASPASPLIAPYPGSFARAQVLGPLALVVVTQAPDPTDDIDRAIADRLVQELRNRGENAVALVDAHNSYQEDRGDLIYGTPNARKVVEDALAAVTAARRAAEPAPVRVGVAARTGYSPREHGLGPEGIRVLVVEAAGVRSAYALIDGNNLLLGLRGSIVGAMTRVVDVAEVLTTDNHVVHEVDGGLNPVGERFPVGRLAADVVSVLEAAIADLEPVEVAVASGELDSVAVLGPGFTARLLTSLGDTLAVFANAFLTTFLLVVTTSLVVYFATI